MCNDFWGLPRYEYDEKTICGTNAARVSLSRDLGIGKRNAFVIAC